MNCEIICVGTELLLGDIVNTNAAHLAHELAGLGVNVYYQSVVGDNPERLRGVLSTAYSRADMVITTGGLGPTGDDLTKETAAGLLGAALTLHAPSLEHIETVFSAQGRAVTDSVKKQAYLPEGCIALHNTTGTAPGFVLEKNGKVLIMLPGPPREMKAMFETGVRPYLTGGGDRLFSARVRLIGIGESDIAERVADLMEGTSPTVAPYAKDTETELRVTACAPDEESAALIIAPAVDEIRRRLGDYVYGVDVDSIQRRVYDLLKASGRTVALAESCTGGLVAKLITDIPGASDVFSLGAVTYSNEMKSGVLDVDSALIERVGAVSREVAAAMAEGVRRISGASVGLSLTGIAGPGGGSDDKPVGLVYVGLCDGTQTEVCEYRLGTKTRGRDLIRRFAASRALNQLRLWLEKKSAPVA